MLLDLSTSLGLVAVVLLVLANGFFVATEFAIVAVRRSRLEQLAAEGNATARAAREVVGRLDTYIAACQLGITMASLALGWLGEPAFAHLVEPPLVALVGSFAPAAAHGVAVAVSFAIITALHIVIGELAPKGLALQRPEGTTLWITRPIQVFELAFRWPIKLLNGVGNGVLGLFGMQPAAGHELVHSVEELRLLVNAAQQAGGVEESEARIASRAFSFADLTAGALMTPRTELDAVPLDAAIPTLRTQLATMRHHRVPVYEGSLDKIAGVLNVADFYRALTELTDAAPAGPPAQRDQLSLRPLLRPAMVVPSSKPADDILEEMRTTGHYFAVVIDEYGGTAGVLTLDDLIEALVGTMAPETSPWPALAQPKDAATQSDGSLLLDGLLRLEEFEDLSDLKLSEEDHDLVETLGGLVMTRLGRIPEVGDEVLVVSQTLRVVEMDGMRVSRLRLLPPPSEAESPGHLRSPSNASGTGSGRTY
ncbi:MAG TPA: hemolysin family protein [Chloroflexota bacterium]|nr:hemolysin family protein [Chloroflexota bacterium]